jgi:hypothetical protein
MRTLNVHFARTWAVLLASLAASCGVAPLPADLILRGGTIWTGNARHPWQEAVAVRGGRIVLSVATTTSRVFTVRKRPSLIWQAAW